MYYDKQIRYIDYLENGEKKRNCGYVKITVTEGRLLLEMWIKGLYETDDVAAEVMLEGAGAEKRIGTVLIEQGSGFFRWERRDTVHLGDSVDIGDGLCYGQLRRIYVQLSPRRNLRCIWREAGAEGTGRAARVPEEEERGTGAENRAAEEEERETARSVAVRVPEEEERGTGAGSGAAEEEERKTARSAAVRVSEEEERGTGSGAAEEEERETARSAAARVSEVEEREAVRSAAVRLPEEEGQGQSARDADRFSKGEERGTGMRTIGQTPEEERQGQSARDAGQSPEGEEREMARSAASQSPEEKGQEQRRGAADRSSEREKREAPHMVALSEDKWQQLQKIYPHVRPFQDEREYLSLRPQDFVILNANAYRLVQNSFLLHGYYNYEHLILTQVSQRNVSQYYIGVPGNFYEKEKQVAVMYGFESFECRREPAQEGDFGYYMIRVEL